MPLRNICLIGLPTAGKTTLGKKLFQHLNKGFIDTDSIIKTRYGLPLPELIKKHGESEFLKIEEETILSLDHKNVVLATGGSAIYSEKSMEHIRSHLRCDVYHLFITKQEFTKRMNNPSNRGVIMNDYKNLREMYNTRLRLYDDYADYIINTNGEVNLNLFKPYNYWKQSLPPFIVYTNKHKYGQSSYPCPPL